MHDVSLQDFCCLCCDFKRADKWAGVSKITEGVLMFRDMFYEEKPIIH